jgi:ATP-dependent Clp protease protease subunit
MPIHEMIDRSAIDRREVYITGVINSEVQYYLTRILSFLSEDSNKPINIILNTPGGLVADGLAIYDLLKSITGARKTPINIVATGQCMSMGAIILQAATKRFATAHCSLGLHELSAANVGSFSSTEDTQKEIRRTQGTLNDIITARTGMTKKKLQGLIARRNQVFTPEEALELNLIDGVIE